MHYLNIDIQNDIFREIMLRRYNRIHKILQKSKNIVFVSNRADDIDVFIDFVQKMQKIYNTGIVYINIRNNENANNIKYFEKLLTSNSKIIEYEFNDTHKDGSDPKTNRHFWLGNIEEWDEIISTISVKKI
jgi:hypothetical protein